MSEHKRGDGFLMFGDQKFAVTYGYTVADGIGGGQIVGDPQVLSEAVDQGGLKLLLADDRIARIILTGQSFGAGMAEFRLAGAPVRPGE